MAWRRFAAAAVLSGLAASAPAAGAGQREEGDAAGGEPSVWRNATELSMVRTQGNAETQTFGFKNTLRGYWPATRLRIRVDGVRARTAGARILVVAPGLRFPPGARPERFATRAGRDGGAPDVEQYFVEGRLERTLGDRFYWNAGTSWDRNHDAGIRNRYVTFGGVGTVWADGADGGGASFSTSYGFSYTVRRESDPDPSKDDRFGGLRIDNTYHQRLQETVELDSDATVNFNLLAAGDYSINVTNAVGVALGEHLSLRVSLQHLYEHAPALDDAAVFARVVLLDPDGTPGSGDELFETVADGGAALSFGRGQLRKDGLDVVLRTALVISF